MQNEPQFVSSLQTAFFAHKKAIGGLHIAIQARRRFAAQIQQRHKIRADEPPRRLQADFGTFCLGEGRNGFFDDGQQVHRKAAECRADVSQRFFIERARRASECPITLPRDAGGELLEARQCRAIREPHGQIHA